MVDPKLQFQAISFHPDPEFRYRPEDSQLFVTFMPIDFCFQFRSVSVTPPGHTLMGMRHTVKKGLMLGRSMFLVMGIGLVIVLLVTGGLFGSESGEVLFFSSVMTYFLVLGWLIMRRVPGNRIGMVFGVMAFSIGLSGLVEGMDGRGNLAATAVAGALWMLWIGSLPLLLLWFPTGRPPKQSWRAAEVVVLSSIGAVVLGSLLSSRLCLDSNGGTCLVWVDNPLGLSWVPNPEYEGLFDLLVIAIFVIALVSLGFRYRISAQIERQQLKWFLFASTGFIFSIFAEIAYESFGGEPAPAWVGIFSFVSIVSIPVAATLAILRYRLYDIDRIISRTVSYALLIGLVGAFYFGSVSLFATFLPSDDPLVVAASTLIVAAAFNPVRRRIQATVDRRFNRSRFAAGRVMELFANSLNDHVEPDEVVQGWVGVVADTMHPAAMSVWVRDS